MAKSGGTNWKPANTGRRVRITHRTHAHTGLKGVITGGWNLHNGACWVRIDGQGFETVVRPGEWEFLDGLPERADRTDPSTRRAALNARQTELLARLDRTPQTGRELWGEHCTQREFNTDIRKLSQRELVQRMGNGWVRS